jgi:hypothetical protein
MGKQQDPGDNVADSTFLLAAYDLLHEGNLGRKAGPESYDYRKVVS